MSQGGGLGACALGGWTRQVFPPPSPTPCVAGVALALSDGEYDYKYTCGGAWCLDPSHKTFADASGANTNHRVIVRHEMMAAAAPTKGVSVSHHISPRASPTEGVSAPIAHCAVTLKPSTDPVSHHISPRASPTEGVSAPAHSPWHAGGSMSGGYAAAPEHPAVKHPAVGVASREHSPGHFGAAVKVHPSAATQGPVTLPTAAHAPSHTPAGGVAAGAIAQRR